MPSSELLGESAIRVVESLRCPPLRPRHLHRPSQQNRQVPCVRVHRHTVATLVCGRVRGSGGLAYVLEATDGFVDVSGRELVKLLVVAEDDDSDVNGAQDAELVCFLEETAFALEEGPVRDR